MLQLAFVIKGKCQLKKIKIKRYIKGESTEIKKYVKLLDRASILHSFCKSARPMAYTYGSPIWRHPHLPTDIYVSMCMNQHS